MTRWLWVLVAVALIAGLAVLLIARPETDQSAVIVESDAIVVGDSGAVMEPIGMEELALNERVAGAPSTDSSSGAASAETPAADLPEIAVDGRIADEEYRYSSVVADVEVFWDHDGVDLYVGLVGPGTGYIALGLDPERRMEGANFILGAVRDGVIVMRDDYGTGFFAHAADTDRSGTDNILLAAGTEGEAGTVIEFSIPLDSGDPTDKLLIPGETYTILVAHHRSNDSFAAMHSERGTGEITLALAPRL